MSTSFTATCSGCSTAYMMAPATSSASSTLAPDGSPCARLDGANEIEIALDASHPWRPDEAVVVMLRSAAVQVHEPNGSHGWQGRVLSRIYLGERTEYVVGIGAARVRAFGSAIRPLDEGARVQLDFPAEAIRAWPAARPVGK